MRRSHRRGRSAAHRAVRVFGTAGAEGSQIIVTEHVSNGDFDLLAT
jgi:hypothetical protein